MVPTSAHHPTMLQQGSGPISYTDAELSSILCEESNRYWAKLTNPYKVIGVGESEKHGLRSGALLQHGPTVVRSSGSTGACIAMDAFGPITLARSDLSQRDKMLIISAHRGASESTLRIIFTRRANPLGIFLHVKQAISLVH